MKAARALLAAVLMVAGGRHALADRGAIVTVGEVDIEEPAQRAIIAYDGAREILILQTDVKADRETKVVEFMPLPGKPTVSLAPKGCFAALGEIVKKHHVRYVIQYRGPRGDGGKGEAVTVVVAAQLGPHAVTVVEVTDADAFDHWVGAFFEKNDLGTPALPADLRDVVSDYLERGIRFFAFDIVTLSPEKQTVQPLAYQFETDHLYYPLKVTNLYGGRGTIELITILPRWLQVRRIEMRPAMALLKEKGLRGAWFGCLNATEAWVAPVELARLHPGIPALMRDAPGRLSAVKYEGPLQFDRDVRVPTTSPEAVCWMFFTAIEARDAKAIAGLVDVPFAFDRNKVVVHRDELTQWFDRLLKKRDPEKHLRITRIVRTNVRDLGAFDTAFLDEHLKGEYHRVVNVVVGEEAVVVFLARRGGKLKVVGFSD